MDKLTSFFTARTAPVRRDLTILALTFGLLCFQFLGRFPLMEPDEGRYSEIPREMLERMDFITPTLNYVKYFEKPPLLYWLNALSFALFGQNEFAARFPCALAGLLTILATYWIGRELFGRRTGLLAALVLGTSAGFIPQARINLTDMPLTFSLTLCLGAFILAVRDRVGRKGLYYHLFYLGAALAVLAKGLIGIVFPGAIIFLFMLFRKKWGVLREMRLPSGIPLFLLVAAPWFVIVSLKNPEFARFFFIHEHFERFLTTVHRRYEPFWYFIPVLLLTLFPWSVILFRALRSAWQQRRGEQGDTLAWLAIWAAFIFLFFSKSSSKLIPYILPIIPPLALLVAVTLDEALERGGRFLRHESLVMAGIFLLAGAVAPFAPLLARKSDLGAGAAILLAAILLAGGWGALRGVRQNSPTLIFVSLGIGTALTGVVVSHAVYTGMAEKRTAKPLALAVRQQATPDTVIASFGYVQTLPFYGGRRTIVVGNEGELAFGSKQGDQSAWFMEKGSFYPLWDSEKKVLAILGKGDLAALAGSVRKPPRVIMENRRKILVANY
jgi:4-amino-4-deoxy-L-arabinose transferase-like glycosyltransferase